MDSSTGLAFWACELFFQDYPDSHSHSCMSLNLRVAPHYLREVAGVKCRHFSRGHNLSKCQRVPYYDKLTKKLSSLFGYCFLQFAKYKAFFLRPTIYKKSSLLHLLYLLLLGNHQITYPWPNRCFVGKWIHFRSAVFCSYYGNYNW